MNGSPSQEQLYGDHIVAPVDTTVEPPLGDDAGKRSVFKREWFKGRMNRVNFTVGLLTFLFGLVSLLFAGFFLADPYIHRSRENLNPGQIAIVVLCFIPIQVVFVIGYASFQTRRLHDLGLKDPAELRGLKGFMPLFLKNGTEGLNKYGKPQEGFGIKQIIGLK